MSAEDELQTPFGSKSWNTSSAESFTCIAVELKKSKSKTQPAHFKPFTLYRLELKNAFRSAVAEINRRFAADFNWQIHVVQRLVSTVLGKKKKLSIKSILHTACSNNLSIRKLLYILLFNKKNSG